MPIKNNHAIIKPMKAEHYIPELLQFPVIASPKLDGIRCHGVDDLPLSNTNKLIPNLFIQKHLSISEFTGDDGELIVGAPNDAETYARSVSGVMSIKGEPDFYFYMFDTWDNFDIPFLDRFEEFQERAFVVNQILLNNGLLPRIKVLKQTLINNLEELDAYESEQVDNGYEGIMIRAPHGLYKFGRSTVKQGWLLKVKRFVDAEAVIIGREELMHNGNSAYIDELGRTKRSSDQDGLFGSGILGSYWVKSSEYEKEFKVSCGSMKAPERKARWDSFEEDKGKLVTYKHFPKGAKDVPRHGIFKAFRHPDDVTDY